MAKQIWEIKHRPKNIDEYIFQTPKDKQIVEKMIEEKSIPHLLFSGFRGTGKTSLAYLLKHYMDVDDVDFLELNASSDNKVEVIRSKVNNWISTMPMGEFKIVFMDEADALTPAAQEALKAMMEGKAEYVRFIFACNQPHKIKGEIKSRCKEIVFKSLDKNQMLERMFTILVNEDVEVEGESDEEVIEILNEYIDLCYPDLRKAVGLMEHNTIDGKLGRPSILDTDGSTERFVSIVNMIENDVVLANREIIFGQITEDECEDVYRMLSDYVTEIFEDSIAQKKAVVVIADHIHKNYFSAIKQATLEACLIRLSEVYKT